MKKILVLALILRIILMSITLHSDFWALVIGGHLLASQGIVNIWDYYKQLSPDYPLVKAFGGSFFPYPPLALFTFGFWAIIVSPFANGMFLEKLAINPLMILGQQGVVWHIFLFKLLYLFFDFGIAWLLWRSFEKPKEKNLALLLWLFNPIVFYSLGVGNLDLLPTSFVILNLFLATRKRLYLAALSLGLGAAFKMFPLFFLPLLLISDKEGFWRKIKITILGIGPLLLSIIPFWNSTAFKSMVLFSPLTQKLFDFKIGAISIVPATLAVIYCLYYFSGRRQDLWKYYLAILLIFFSFSYYHLQWFVWLAPFWVIGFVRMGKRFWGLYLALVVCWLVNVAFSSADLHFGLFVPIKTLGLFQNLTPQFAQSVSPATIVGSVSAVDVRELARSVFGGISLVVVFVLLGQSKKRYLKRV